MIDASYIASVILAASLVLLFVGLVWRVVYEFHKRGRR